MKHIRTYGSLALVAAMLCLASCKKEGETVTLKVQFEQGAAQKIYLSEGNSVNWYPHDKARINGEEYEIANAAVTLSASENGYTAVYPASAGNTMEGNKVTVNIYSTQECKRDPNGNQILDAPMVARLDQKEGTLMFRNAGSLLRVRVPNPNKDGKTFQLDFIRVQTSKSDISGKQSVTINGNTTTNGIDLGTITGGGRAIRLEVNETLAAGETKDYYVLLAPLSDEGITVDMVGTEDGDIRKDYVKTSQVNVTLNRSVVGNVLMDDFVAEDDPPAFDDCPCKGPGKEYTFYVAPGNLRYHTGNKIFSFAEQQQDVIYNNGVNTNPQNSGLMDLFGWGTSGYNNSLPTNTMDTTTGQRYGEPYRADYKPTHIAGTNYDWGLYNTIYSADGRQQYVAGTWRMPSACEFEWLLGFYGTVKFKNHNDNDVSYKCDDFLTATNRRSGATVNDMPGFHFVVVGGITEVYPHQCVLFFPDNITLTEIDYSGGKPNQHSGDYKNTFGYHADSYFGITLSKADWEKMEKAGVVLLPGAAYRSPSNMGPQNTIYYWTSTASDAYMEPYYLYSTTKANSIGLFRGDQQGSGRLLRSHGMAVRLIREVKNADAFREVKNTDAR